MGLIVQHAGAIVVGAALCFALGSYLERIRRSHRYPCGAIAQTASCVVRWASSADAATILKMIKGLAEFEQCSTDVVVTETILRRDFEAGLYECLLAEQPGADGDCLGFAFFYNRYSTSKGRCIYLEDLFVMPEARGSGVGLLLLGAVAQVATARACARVFWCALDWNANAIAFYLRSGARERLADAAGTRYVNFVLDGAELAALAAGNQARDT